MIYISVSINYNPPSSECQVVRTFLQKNELFALKERFLQAKQEAAVSILLWLSQIKLI